MFKTSMHINGSLKDGTTNFLPINRPVNGSTKMFRNLTSLKTGEIEKIEQEYIRLVDFSDLFNLVEKFGNKLVLKKSRFLEVPFEIYIKRNYFW